MSMILAFSIAAILALVGAIHIYWAFGGVWPGKDDLTLARTVVGANGIKAMPPRWITGLVAIGIFVAALLPPVWLGAITTPFPRWLMTTAICVLTLIFLIRGIGGFIPAVQRMNSEEPFATLDKRFFSPLILVIGLALTYLLMTNPWTLPS